MNAPTPFRFDGHGINDANGRRLAKLSFDPYDTESGLPIRRQEFDDLSRLFAAAPELLDTLRELHRVTESYLRGDLVTFPTAIRQQSAQVIAKATRPT